ncbi:MAG: MBL fold metallo-hydrolase [Clostridia bacterium]
MYELKQVGENTYYINCPTRIGIYKITQNEVCIMDTGSDKDAGKKILKILEEKQWKLKMIINTHSHADHIGGNRILQERCQCPIYTYGIEEAFIKYPILEPAFLYGGYPGSELRNKFLLAQDSHAEILTPEILPEGLEMQLLNGHSFSMVGIKTADDVWFLGDSVVGQETIEKYAVFFLYDVKAYLASLDIIEKLEGKLFIPSHAEPMQTIEKCIEQNRNKIFEIAEYICQICKEAINFENILKAIFDYYQLQMNITQYALVGSTIKSYLTYLQNEGKLVVQIQENQLLWKKV